MKTAKALTCAAVLCCGAFGLQLAAQRGAPLTPEQEQERAARAAATALAEGVRPIDMLDSVWIEELSWMTPKISGATTI